MHEVGDPVEMLRAGLVAFLDVCNHRPLIQISMLDAPMVLGWAAWRETASTTGLRADHRRTSRPAWTRAAASPKRPTPCTRPARCGRRGALYIANADDPNLARTEMEPVLISLLDGQRTQS